MEEKKNIVDMLRESVKKAFAEVDTDQSKMVVLPAQQVIDICYENDKLKEQVDEYERKIEQGTLIELPCKVGDTVYVIYQYDDFMGTTEEPFIEKDTVSFFVYDDNKMKIVPSNYAERSDYWYTTIDIFLTREEAEKRLKELQV